jgi:lipopolysaccharide export system protein LptA
LVVITQPSPTGPVVERIRAKGNVYLKLDAAPATTAQPNPTEKELWAATADLFYYPDGQFLREAQAEQQVIMIETPVNAVAPAEKRTLNADKGKVLFYETNNLMQEFIAQGEVKVTIQPYPRAGEEPSPPKVSQSAQANLNFDRAGELLTARQEGNFRYQEGLRHALAERANYDSAKKFLTLREGKVMVWDDKARTQADEIDLYLISEESRARGHVRSTYYNPSTAGGATPFRNVKSPVFITANEAQSFYKRGEGIYTGEARAWQDDNFVKADRLELYRDDQRMVATGQVASALYQKKASETNTVPIFATADQMVYSDKNRRVEYQGTVKMRQAEESLDAAQVKIWLNDTDNQVKKLEAYQQVVLVQPGRRGEGEQAVYTAEDQRTVLLGNLAKVVSQAQGIVTGRRLTLLSGDDRILADDQQNSKRTRSVHTIQR